MHQIPKLISLAKGGEIIVSLKQEISDVLKSKKVKFKCLEDYPQPYEGNALKWMKEWPHRKLNGETFIQSLVHDKLSVWWLMENWLYYSTVYFDSLRDILLSMQTIDIILKQERPDEIVFVDDGKINSGILKLFTEYKRRIIPMKMFNFLYTTKRKAKVFFIRNFIEFGFVIRKFLWHATRPFRKEASGEILLISTYEWGLERKRGGYVNYDPFIDPVISEMKNSSIITANIPVGRLLGLRQLLNNSRSPVYKVLEKYYNTGVNKRCNASVRAILGMWNNLKHENSFTNSFEYMGKNIWPLVENQFSAYFYSRLHGHIQDAELINSMLETEQPKIVVYPAEISEFGRTLFHSCNLYGIPSVGIQHGVFNNYLACIHKKGESAIGAASPDNCPIPTKTFVYGPKYRRMLLKGNYPVRSVVVTGSQRFDRIILDRHKFNKAQFCETIGIDEGKKIIAFVTSPVPRGDTETMATAVIEATKRLDAQLVIKLHPSEEFAVYEKVATETKSGAIIVRDIDLYELLDACDVMITHLSTAAIEAMIFDKPVILLNLTGKSDRVDYAKKSAAFGVYRKENLLPVLRKLLCYKKFYAERRRQIRPFVVDNAYLSDGKAAKRMAELIEKLAKKH